LGARNVIIRREVSSSHSTSTVSNTLIGYNAGIALGSSDANVAIGYNALLSKTSGLNDMAIGNSGLEQLIAGGDNVAIGPNSLRYMTGGNSNFACGTDAGGGLTQGDGNIFLGSSSGEAGSYSNRMYIPGDSNIGAISDNAIGYALFYDTTTGRVGPNRTGSIAGATSLNGLSDAYFPNAGPTGSMVIGFKPSSITDRNMIIRPTTGATLSASSFDNVIIGFSGAGGATSCTSNVILGSKCMNNASSLTDNVVIGTNITHSNACSQNVLIGSAITSTVSGTVINTSIMGYNNRVVNSTSTCTILGANNTQIGNTGIIIGTGNTGSGTSIIIGRDSTVSSPDSDSCIIIGRGTIPGIRSNVTVINPLFNRTAATADNAFYINEQLTAGSLSYNLTYDYATGRVQPVLASSRRFKQNIVPLETNVDTTCIYNLTPVFFEYKESHAGRTGVTSLGLIAEDVYDVCPHIVLKDSNDVITNIRYDMISVLLLSEIKKLRTELTTANNTIASLTTSISDITTRLTNAGL
jgi:hypothetical protein